MHRYPSLKESEDTRVTVMQRAHARIAEQANESARQLEERLAADGDRGDATIDVPGPLRVEDENLGGDPYNRTGRFSRTER